MVKSRVAIFAFILFSTSLTAQADGFTAQVDQKAIGLNDTLDLRLDLADVAASGDPDLSSLGSAFRVLGQQESNEVQVMNGVKSSSTHWDISLEPLAAGTAEIPSISIYTTRGVEKSEPIVIQVSAAGTVGQKATSGRNGVTLVARASELQPYRDQPVMVTYRMTTTEPIRNLQLGEFRVKDAILELRGQPKVETRIVHGRQVQDLVMNYLVTPLRDGALTLPPFVLRGEMADASSTDQSAGSESPFAEMEKMMGTFGAGSNLLADFAPMKPVTIISNPINLVVRPAVAGISPWLPARDVTLSESWSGEPARVGEPLIRTVTTHANGVAPSQLTGFGAAVSDSDAFRVYPDPARLSSSNSRSGNGIVSERVDRMTLIPQKAGDLSLPQLSVRWWDTETHQLRISNLPGRMIRVKPGIAGTTIAPVDVHPALTPQALRIEPPHQSLAGAFGLGMLFFVLASVLVGCAFKIAQSNQRRKRVNLAKDELTQHLHKIKLSGSAELSKCTDVRSLQNFLQTYANDHWNVPLNSPLAQIFAAAGEVIVGFDRERAHILAQQIEDALYAGKPANPEVMRAEIATLIFRKSIRPNTHRVESGLAALNPT